MNEPIKLPFIEVKLLYCLSEIRLVINFKQQEMWVVSVGTPHRLFFQNMVIIVFHTCDSSFNTLSEF